MVKRKAKVAALLLASLMTIASVGMFSGCSKKETSSVEEDTIAADSIWFNSKKIKLESPYDMDDVATINMNSAVYMDDFIYVLITGERNFNITDAEKDPDFNYNDYIISSVAKFDLDGNFIDEIEIFNDSGLDIMQAISMSLQNNKLKIMCIGGNANAGSTSNINVILDPKTGEAKLEEFEFDGGEMSFVEGSYDIGDSTVSLVFDFASNKTSYKAVISKEGKTVNTIDLSSATTKQFDGIDNVLVIDDETIAFACMGKEYFTLELNVSTGKVSEAEKNINTGGRYYQTSQDGSSYAIDFDGIYGFDDNLDPELLMDFSDTNINVSGIYGGSIALLSDDKIIAFNQDYRNILVSDSYIYVFEKAEENPNAGKKILDVYSLSGELSYSEAESIVKFNETNSDYFVKMSFADYGMEDSEDYGVVNEVSDNLMIDVINGEGPDIILNAQGVEQFNTPAYFVDLVSFIDGDNGLDKSKYFDNILNASKTTDGAIYQMPISVEVDGIMALKKNVAEGKIGFSYDEYLDFLNDVCNGNNPLRQSRTEFVVSAIKSGVIPYLNDGTIDFNNDEFKTVAEFAKNNIFDEFDGDEEDGMGLGLLAALGSSNNPTEVRVFSARDYTMALSEFHGDVGLYGYPAPSETGLTAKVVSSASISSTLDEEAQNASWDFIKIMLDEDIQNEEDEGLPLNRASFKKVVQDAIDIVNNEYDMYIKMGISESMLKQFGMKRTDNSVGDTLYDATESITRVAVLDTAIAPIIEEEIDAYFAGQKSIDDVIKIINDKVQTVINERGSN